MSNSILTNDIITKECMMSLKNNLVIARGVSREYSDEFAKTGAKIGNVCNIRKPSRYEVTEGAVLNIQDTVDQSVALTLDKHYHVGMAFSEVDRTLSIDKFRERYIDPAMIALANKIDSQLAIDMKNQVFTALGVPSATALPSTLKGFTQAKAYMALLGAPAGQYSAVVDPLVQSSMVDGLKGLFQSSDKIADQYESGLMGIAGGCKFSESANVPKHLSGAVDGTPLVKTTITTQGATAIAVDGISTASITGAYKKGDVIQIAGVYAVNPQTRQSTGFLKQFVVTADADASSNEIASLAISPAIYSTGQYQNVDALPADGAAITLFGHATNYASLTVPQNLVFHKSAFAMGVADFEMPGGNAKASRAVDKDSGLSFLMTEFWDGVNFRTIHRIDFLGGWKCVYPELAARVVGQPA